MANVIKHKRGSGSDPSASNLVIGELAIRTDNGKLFTKMDSGAIAEIAGGGSDIAINTLSSSSGTGGGSATFNGSAYRFTLSSPPSVSAAQLLVSVNGVIQKPVAGTGQPSEGFSVDGNDIIFGDAPATGADFFILTFRSLGVSEPAANSVTNAKVASNAAIAGTKISPDFGSQNITTTGNLTIDTNTLHVDSSNNRVGIGTTSPNTKLEIEAVTTNVLNLTDGQVQIVGNNPIAFVSQSNLNPALNRWGFKVYANNVDGNFSIFDYRNSRHSLLIDSSGRVGLGDTSPDRELVVKNASSNATIKIEASNAHTSQLFFSDTDAENPGRISLFHGSGQETSNSMLFDLGGTTRMAIGSSGNVGIGTTSPGSVLHVDKGLSGSPLVTFHQLNGNSSADAGLEVETSSTGTYIQRWVNSASEKMRVTGNGLVGIGTSTPAEKLDVAGNIKFGANSNGLIAEDGVQLVFKANISGREAHIMTHDGNEDINLNPDGYIQFETAGTEAMRIDSSGHFTLGRDYSTNPSNVLTGVTILRGHAVNTGTTDNDYQQLYFKNSTVSGSSSASIRAFRDDSNYKTGLRIYTNNTNSSGGDGDERVRISADGKIGINTSTPEGSGVDITTSRTTHYSDNADQRGLANLILRQTSDAANRFVGLSFVNGGSYQAEASINLMQTGNYTGDLRFKFRTGGGSTDWRSRFRMTAAGMMGFNGNPNRYLHVSGRTDGGNFGTAAFEQNNINNSAAVMFMSTLRDGNAGESFLQCNRDQDNNGQGVKAVFFIRTNGDCDSDTNSYGGISDIKLKENIVDAKSQWDDIKNIRVRNFNFKDNPGQKMLGVVAQEVETVSAGLVKDCPDENITSPGPEGTSTKSVKYSILYMKAIKALQEAMTRIETLESKVTALEAK